MSTHAVEEEPAALGIGADELALGVRRDGVPAPAPVHYDQNSSEVRLGLVRGLKKAHLREDRALELVEVVGRVADADRVELRRLLSRPGPRERDADRQARRGTTASGCEHDVLDTR